MNSRHLNSDKIINTNKPTFDKRNNFTLVIKPCPKPSDISINNLINNQNKNIDDFKKETNFIYERKSPSRNISKRKNNMNQTSTNKTQIDKSKTKLVLLSDLDNLTPQKDINTIIPISNDEKINKIEVPHLDLIFLKKERYILRKQKTVCCFNFFK